MPYATLSDLLVEAALISYAGALLGFVIEAIVGGRTTPALAPRTEAVTASRSSEVSTAPDQPPDLVADVPEGRRLRILDGAGRVGDALVRLAFGFHVGAIVCRGLAANRVPWGNMYEFALVGAAAAVGAFLWLGRQHDVRYLGPWVAGLVLTILGFSVTLLYVDAVPLLPALRSTWLVIHVLAAIIATGLFSVGALVSGLYLVRQWRRPNGEGRFLARLPDGPALDRVAFRVHAVAFPIWAFAVTAGAIWAQYAWGRYWGWDPKEVWAFISFVVYASYLHARATAGWKGTRAALVALVGYATIIFNFVGVNIWFVGLHSYGGL